jgi:uncharacterized membrane protein YhaH (DUF805 family)
MNFVDAVKACFAKYADFNGRARLSEYWWFQLFFILVYLVLIIGQATHMSLLTYAGGIAVLGLLVPALAVGSRRLHDTGKSGWYQLIGLIPLLGGLVMIYFFVQSGEAGDNRYGPAVV